MTSARKEQSLILIADDNVWMQRIIAKILISYGLKPAFANDGYEAIARAIDLQPAAVILDIIMPDMTGLQTLRLLKTISITKDIPVLVITVASDADNLGSAIKYGAAGFIRKPFTRASIFDKLSDAIGKEHLDYSNKTIQKVSDEELDDLMGIHQTVEPEEKQVRSGGRKKVLSSANPSTDSQAINRYTNPEFNLLLRTIRESRQQNNSEVPDEDIIQEILKHTTRR